MVREKPYLQSTFEKRGKVRAIVSRQRCPEYLRKERSILFQGGDETSLEARRFAIEEVVGIVRHYNSLSSHQKVEGH